MSITTPSAPPVECATADWNPFCTVDAYIRQQVAHFLDRAPRLDELNQWREYLDPDSAPAQRGWNNEENFFLDELRQTHDIVAGPVIRLYEAYFLRHPDFVATSSWRNAVLNGRWSLGQVSDFFANSTEFQTRYGALDDAEFASLVYENVMGRQADAPGQQYWERQLQSGRSRGWMMAQFTEAPEDIQNKTRTIVAVTEIYAAMLDRMPTLAEYNTARFTMISGRRTAPAVGSLAVVRQRAEQHRVSGTNQHPLTVTPAATSAAIREGAPKDGAPYSVCSGRRIDTQPGGRGTSERAPGCGPKCSAPGASALLPAFD